MKIFLLLLVLGTSGFALGADVSSAEARDRIEALRRELGRHDALYFREATSEISDAEYDRLKQRLADLERTYPQAAREAGLLERIGDDRSGALPTRRHREPMLSLDKAYTPGELRAFHGRLAKVIGHGDLDYVVEPKIDGVAVSVVYEKGRLARAVTRGNGMEGDDITANVLRISGVAPTLPHLAGVLPPDLIELRGEIYVPLAEFTRVNAARDQAGEARFANPRNLAAGAIRLASGDEMARRGLQVVFFGVGACEPAGARPTTQRALRTTLRGWGLPTVTETWGARGLQELERAVEALGRARAGLAFPTDGAVVKLDAVAQQREVGTSEVAPRWAVAYKFAPERVEAQVRAITLQVGRTGVLTPVAELEPVWVSGSRISRATLHNRDEVARKDVRVGDFVYVEKAGDVIPAIAGVNFARRAATVQAFAFPSTCPSCHAPLVRNEDEAAVRCPYLPCPAQQARRIEHFASNAGVDIEGLGVATIDALVGNGWVKEVPDLYRLRRADLLTLGRNNERTVDRLLAAIERSKGAELWRVIHGLGLPQVGAATAKDLARQCESLAGLAEHGPRALAALADPRFQGLIADLISVGMGSPASAAALTALAGRTFVLTGTLPTFTRAQITAKIEQAGGRVSGSVSRGTDYLVAGTEPGAKLEQAAALNISVIDEAGLLQLLEEASVKDR